MNHEEIAREIKRDYDKIFSSSLLRLGAEYDKERRKFRIDKLRNYTKVYTIKTAAKNNWIIVMGKSPSKEKYLDSSSLTVCCVTYFFDNSGLNVYNWAHPGVVQYYDSHFFYRYNERLKLGISSPIDVVKRYFKHNRYSQAKAIIKKNRIYSIGFSKDGMLLGDMTADCKWLEWRTFVSKDLMKQDQSELEEKIFKDLEIEVLAGLKDQFGCKNESFQLDKLNALTRDYRID